MPALKQSFILLSRSDCHRNILHSTKEMTKTFALIRALIWQLMSTVWSSKLSLQLLDKAFVTVQTMVVKA